MKNKNKIILFFFLAVLISQAKAQSVGGTTTGAATYCSTSNSGFVSVIGHVGTILNWESSTDGGVTWNSSAVTSQSQTYFNLPQTTCYRAIVKNGTFPPDTSTIACITIHPPSIGGTITGGGTFCSGSGPGTLNLTGNLGAILFWEYSINAGNTWTTISNTTNTLTYANITVNTLYRTVVQNGSTCPKDTSNQISFTIIQSAAGTINGNASVCAASNNGTLTLNNYKGSVINWESSINSGTSWNPITNTTPSQSYLNLTQTIWYRAIVKNGNCASLTTPHIVITVSPATVVGTLSGGGNYCGVPATGVLTLSGYVGNITTWLSSINQGLTYSTVVNAAPTLNYTNLPISTLYKVVVKSGGCSSDTSNVEMVKVAPQTVAGTITSSATVCHGANNDSILLSGKVGSVLDWIYSIDNGLTWKSTGSTSTKKIYSGLTQTTFFKVIVQSGNCNMDTTNVVKITILPVSSVNAGNDATLTRGESLTLNGTGSGIPSWSPSAGLNDNTIFSPVATPSNTTVYILSVIDTNGCINSDTVIITVNDLQNLKITNILTPNGDGMNDTWYIEDVLNFPENDVSVYNIYGIKVYNKKGYTNDWQGTYNGSELPEGAYYYVVNLGLPDKIFKGSLDILRNN